MKHFKIIILVLVLFLSGQLAFFPENELITLRNSEFTTVAILEWNAVENAAGPQKFGNELIVLSPGNSIVFEAADTINQPVFSDKEVEQFKKLLNEDSADNVIQSETQTENLNEQQLLSTPFRRSVLEQNILRATYHNFGFAGRTSEDNTEEMFFEFPANSNRSYLYSIGMMFGAMVENQLDGSELPIVVVPYYRSNPDTGDPWHWMPTEGYSSAESSEVPKKSDPNTWPEIWSIRGITEWPALVNDNDSVEELYIRFDDSEYDKYLDGRFRPVTDNPDRGGLGIDVEMWVLASDENELSNTHFVIYDIQNNSDYDFTEAAISLWIVDWLGTPDNDRPIYDLYRDGYYPNNIQYFTDTRPVSSPPEFDNTTIGVAGIKFLKTPKGEESESFSEETALPSRVHYRPSGTFPSTNDEQIYQEILSPGEIEYLTIEEAEAGEYDTFVVFGPFSIVSGETKRFAFAVSVAQAGTPSNAADIEMVTENLLHAQTFWEMNDGFATSAGEYQPPTEFVLKQNYPNPFNPVTVIGYQLAISSEVTLEVFDITGRKVATLAKGMKNAGTHEVHFDASSLSSGMYIYRIQAGEFVETRKLILLK